MKLLDQKIRFDTEVGTLEIGTTPDSLYYFEFLDGYSNGLHNPEPFKTFDAAYRAARKALNKEVYNLKFDI